MRASSIAAALASGALLLGGCSTQDGTDAAGAPLPVVSHLRVGLTEWEITTRPAVLAAGTVTFEVTNAGSAPHDLVVRGHLGTWETRHLSPGERTRLVVEAAPGEQLHLDCDLAGHHAAGMHGALDVAPRSPTHRRRPWLNDHSADPVWVRPCWAPCCFSPDARAPPPQGRPPASRVGTSPT